MSDTLEVIFLGTGGGVPSARRYLPAVALRYGGDWLLFDAGEGVQMRLRESPLGWGGLQAVFISHLHGDHVLGLPGLLMSIGMNRMERPVTIFGPPGLQKMVEVILETCRVQLPFPVLFQTTGGRGEPLLNSEQYSVTAFTLQHRIPCSGFVWREHPRPGRFFPERARSLGVPEGPLFGQLQRGSVVTLNGGRVVTPEDVMGEPRAGRVVVYATDTAPTELLVEHAHDADLLIHDATFGDGFEREARLSGHSTARQAASQALAANCRQLALTHISARYEDSSSLLDEARAIFPNTLLASDRLSVPIPARE